MNEIMTWAAIIGVIVAGCLQIWLDRGIGRDDE